MSARLLFTRLMRNSRHADRCLFLPVVCGGLMVLAVTVRLPAEETIEPVPSKLPREVNYEQDIAPLLKKNCVACHNATTPEGELNLESPAAMLKGGASGESIIPGDPDASFLYLVASRQSEPYMPPLPNKMNAHKLTGEEVWKLKRWIEQGAKGEAAPSQKAVQWSTTLPAHLQPVYALTIFPQEEKFVTGRGGRVELISLTDPAQRLALIDPELKTAAHRDFVNAIALHPSGRILATAGFRNVKIWEEQSPETLQTIPDSQAITAWGVSPGRQHFAMSNAEGILWTGLADTALTDTVVTDTVKSWKTELADIPALAIDDSGLLVIAAQGNTLKLLKPDSQEMLDSTEVDSPVHSLQFLQEQVYSGHADGTLRQWTLSAEKNRLQPTENRLMKHGGPVTGLLAVTAPVAHLLSLEQNGTLILWNLAEKTPLLEWATGADTAGFTYSPASQRLATWNRQGQVIVWNHEKKQERVLEHSALIPQKIQQLETEQGIAKALSTNAQARKTTAEKDLTERKTALEKAEKELATATEAATKATTERDEAQKKQEAVEAQIAESEATEELKKSLADAQKALGEKQKQVRETGQTQARAQRTLELNQTSVNTATAELATLSSLVDQSAARIQQLEQQISTAQEEQKNTPLAARSARFVNPHQLEILTAAGQCENWNLLNGKPLLTQELPESTAVDQWLELADSRVCLLRTEGNAQVVNLTPGWKLRSRLGTPEGVLDVEDSVFVDRVTALAFSPEGDLLVTGGGEPSRSGELMFWDWQNALQTRNLTDVHSDIVLSLAFSRDGSQLLTGAADKFVRILDVATGEKRMLFEGHTEHVLSVAWSAEGLLTVSASADKTVKIWNTLDGTQKRTLSNFTKQVTGVSFIGTTDKVVSSSGDKIVRMHQTENGSNYRNLSGSDHFLYTVAVTGDEGLVISGGQNGTIRIWNGQDGKLLHTLIP